MTEEDRWRGIEPPSRGPSAPPDLEFNPLAVGIAVFTGVAIPVIVVGYTRPRGPNTLIIVLGAVVGLVLGILVGLWLARRDGRAWRGSRF